MRRFGWMALPLLLTVAAVAAAADGAAPRIAVIVAPDDVRIASDRHTLREVFLERIRIDARGRRLVPLNLPPEDPLREAFSEALLGQAPQRLEQYWNQRYFQGVSPPYVVRSQEAMLRFVAATPGAIGYVLSCRADDRVRVLARLPLPAEFAARLAGECPSASRAPLPPH